jgi:hypothetical protein
MWSFIVHVRRRSCESGSPAQRPLTTTGSPLSRGRRGSEARRAFPHHAAERQQRRSRSLCCAVATTARSAAGLTPSRRITRPTSGSASSSARGGSFPAASQRVPPAQCRFETEGGETQRNDWFDMVHLVWRDLARSRPASRRRAASVDASILLPATCRQIILKYILSMFFVRGSNCLRRRAWRILIVSP